MSNIPDGGPAFPVSLPGWGDNGVSGMSLRDWYAGMALQGMVARGWQMGESSLPRATNTWAIASYELADAMLKARG